MKKILIAAFMAMLASNCVHCKNTQGVSMVLLEALEDSKNTALRDLFAQLNNEKSAEDSRLIRHLISYLLGAEHRYTTQTPDWYEQEQQLRTYKPLAQFLDTIDALLAERNLVAESPLDGTNALTHDGKRFYRYLAAFLMQELQLCTLTTHNNPKLELVKKAVEKLYEALNNDTNSSAQTALLQYFLMDSLLYQGVYPNTTLLSVIESYKPTTEFLDTIYNIVNTTFSKPDQFAERKQFLHDARALLLKKLQICELPEQIAQAVAAEKKSGNALQSLEGQETSRLVQQKKELPALINQARKAFESFVTAHKAMIKKEAPLAERAARYLYNRIDWLKWQGTEQDLPSYYTAMTSAIDEYEPAAAFVATLTALANKNLRRVFIGDDLPDFTEVGAEFFNNILALLRENGFNPLSNNK